MKKKNLRTILIFGVISILGIIVIQTYFIKKSLKFENQRTSQSISIALRNVAISMMKMNNQMVTYENPVHQYSNDYYIVNINSMIDANVLEELLILEFASHNINLDFEYGIYDCQNDKMVYGNYIKSFKKHDKEKISPLPKSDNYVYYFGISFPTIQGTIISDLGVWYFFSAVLLIVIVFFSYSIIIILRQTMLSELQKEFINNITHELKTPLTSIQICASVITKEVENTDHLRVKTYSKIITTQSHNLLKHIENILTFAKSEKRHNLNLEKINAVECINEIVDGFKSIIEPRSGNIEFKHDYNKISIFADKFHIRNIISNIIDNSIKYSKDAPEIKIYLNREKLTISDNGIGIDKKNIRKIFHRFYRVSTGDVHDVKGFGIGLSYVKKVCKLHRWKISLNSALNKGTIVTISGINKNNYI